MYSSRSEATNSPPDENHIKIEDPKDKNVYRANPSFDSQKCHKQKYKLCSSMPIDCMECSTDNPKAANCIYGEPIKAKCTVKNITECQVTKLNLLIFQKLKIIL